MSKEAMKLALKGAANYIDALGGDSRKYRQVLANEALDKKAENARELGLDYEPAQQEPVAWMDASGDIYKHELWPNWNPPHTPLYTSPPAQQDIQRLSALVRAQQITIDKLEAQRTWVGLTDAERKLVRDSVGYNQFVTAGEYAEHVQNATEFKLMEKNT